MAADPLLTLPSRMPASAAGSKQVPSGAPPHASSPSPSPAPARADNSEHGAEGADASASQTGQPSDNGPSATDGPGSDSTDAPRSSRSGKAHSAKSGTAGRPSGASSSSASSPSSAKGTAQPAGATDNFSATLAQSLAATPADGLLPAGKPSAKTGTDEPGQPAAKHSAADPVANALALLEHALAGALMGLPSTPPPVTASASASGVSTQGSRAVADGKSTATLLNALLTQNLSRDPKAAASAPNSDGSATALTPATTVGAAALTAAQLAAGSHLGAAQSRSDPTTMALSSPVGSGAWTDELATRVTWMAHQGIESASLQLSPEHLGPLQVSISVHNGQASVWFGAAQPDTRSALQQSLPQLRQLFATQGLTLADAGVSREPPRGQSRRHPTRTAAPVAGVAAVNLEGSASRAAAPGGLGLVDTYV